MSKPGVVASVPASERVARQAERVAQCAEGVSPAAEGLKDLKIKPFSLFRADFQGIAEGG